METIISKLVEAFESGQMTRRQLVGNLLATSLLSPRNSRARSERSRHIFRGELHERPEDARGGDSDVRRRNG